MSGFLYQTQLTSSSQESPRWQAKIGRIGEARDVLRVTRYSNIEFELREIKRVVKYELETSSANHYAAMLFPKDNYSRQLRWRTVLAVWLQIMQELVDVGVITVYAVDLFSSAGFNENTSKLLAGYNNLSYMLSVIFAAITLDRYDRRCKYRLLHSLTHHNCLASADPSQSATMVRSAIGMALELLLGGILDKYAAHSGLH